MAESESGEIELPTKEEIAKLPRPAQVAFAARCARRVQPLFDHSWPDAPQEHLKAVAMAIALAETAGAGANLTDADAAANAAAAASAATSDVANDVAHAAASAASAAASDAVNAAANSRVVNATHAAADVAADATMYAGFVGEFMPAMRRDFELLRAAAKHEKWTNETPVPPEFFGPLWPDGTPEDWPLQYERDDLGQSALRLHFAIPAEMDREQADRIIQEIIVAANELHHAYGGSGLTIADRIRVYEPALVPTGGDA